MQQNWWDQYQRVDQPQQGPVTMGTPRPRLPPPQTAPQAQGDVLRNVRVGQEIQMAPGQEARDAARFTREGDQQRQTRISQYRTEFQGLPQVRDFMSTRDAFQTIQRLAGSVPDNDPMRSQADLALTYSFIRALDPGGRVTESEEQMVAGSAPIPQQARIAFQRLQNGQSLTPEMRAGMVRAAYDAFQVRARGYNQTARQYQQYFRDLGEDPNRHIQIALGPERERELLEQRQQGQQQPGQPRRPGDRVQFDYLDQERPQGQQLPEGFEQWRETLQAAVQEGRFRNVGEAIAFARQANPTFAAIYDQPQHRSGLQRAVAAVRRDPRTRVDLFTSDRPQAPPVTVNPEALLQERLRREGEPGVGPLVQQGSVLGLGDEVSGLANVARNAYRAPFTNDPFSPLEAYTAGRDADLNYLDRARQNTGWAGTGAELLGGLASGRPGAGLFASAPTIGGRMLQGSRIGAQQGAIAGAGYAESPRGQIDPLAAPAGAAVGALTGGTVGALLPPVAAGANLLVQAGRRAFRGGDPAEVARRTIAQAIAGDANTPGGVGREMAEAQDLGVPYMLADSGDNVRGLLGASARSPGPARTLARDALEARQEGLSERVTGAIQRDLGPISNPHLVAEGLVQRAEQAATPLREAAYARPGADAFGQRIAPLLNRPSMRRAMASARRIAEEEGRDPTTLGFEINSAGEVTVNRVPSWQTLDYIKRGMDDIVESYRDPTTGRLNLDTEGRAINNTLRGFLRRFDVANPDYAAYRQAWSGPLKSRDALELGRGALNMLPDDMTARTQNMTPGELEFFRLGVRRAMAETISRRGDTADSVNAIIGTPARRAALQRVFGGRQEFNRFVRTLQLEREGHRTYRSATQGSPTAQNLQNDAGLARAAPIALDMMGGGGIATGLSVGTRALANARAATAGNEAREQIATILSETDPTRLAELGRELVREAARRRAASRGARKRNIVASRGLGNVAGGAAGQQIPNSPYLIGPR